MSTPTPATPRALRLWLEPDRLYPRFQRLTWEKVDVPIRDVLVGGVHPWMENPEGTDIHPSLIDAILKRLNDSSAKVSELGSFGYTHDVCAQQIFYRERKTRFERTLDVIRECVYFVDGLTYLQLLDIAKQRLRESWDHRTAHTLAERACPTFQELRQFLKAKDKSIKLSGYGDIGQYDLGQVLSLDDFEDRDGLIVAEAIPSLNFRKAGFLGNITDSHGRLRLVPDIRRVTLTMVPEGTDYVHLVWHVERDGETCRFRPEVGGSDAKRKKAAVFAEEWREDDGRLCFNTSLRRLSEMVERRVVVPSFPSLNYGYEYRGPTATAEVHESRVTAYFIGGFYDKKSNGDSLKEILREYGVSMSGNKAQLLQKLAKLTARQYTKHLPEMDSFFSRNRFVRISAIPPKSERLPLLEDERLLRSLLLTMYALKHLRGSAILDAAHDNNTYTVEQLAHALLNGKVAFTGAFLRAG